MGQVAPLTDGFAHLGHLHLFADGDFDIALDHIEVFDGSGQMGSDSKPRLFS